MTQFKAIENWFIAGNTDNLSFEFSLKLNTIQNIMKKQQKLQRTTETTANNNRNSKKSRNSSK